MFHPHWYSTDAQLCKHIYTENKSDQRSFSMSAGQNKISHDLHKRKSQPSVLYSIMMGLKFWEHWLITKSNSNNYQMNIWKCWHNNPSQPPPQPPTNNSVPYKRKFEVIATCDDRSALNVVHSSMNSGHICFAIAIWLRTIFFPNNQHSKQNNFKFKLTIIWNVRALQKKLNIYSHADTDMFKMEHFEWFKESQLKDYCPLTYWDNVKEGKQEDLQCTN